MNKSILHTGEFYDDHHVKTYCLAKITE